MTLRLGLWLAALGACIVFVWFALHWREEAIRNALRADAAERQAALNATTGAISDRVASDRVIILETGHKEVANVRTIPGAETPLDPARRASVCGSLGRVFDDPGFCAPAGTDSQPESAVRDPEG